MKKFLFLAGVTSCLSLSVFAELTARSYITKGLVVHWDGIENVAYGAPHDAVADKWTDLTGHGANVTVWGSASFQNNNSLAVTRAAKSSKLSSVDVILNAFASASYTAEFAYNKTVETPKSSKGYKTALCSMLMFGSNGFKIGSSGDTLLGFCPNKSSSESTVTAAKTVTTTLGQHTFSCRQDGTAWAVYVDNLSAKTGTVTPIAAPSTTHGVVLNGDYYADMGLDGCYYAFRFYDRALTADEVAINHAVDQVRFFAADPDDLSLPDGWKFTTDDDVKLMRQLTIAVKNGAGGTITVNGGDPTVEDKSMWVEQSQMVEVTLTATAAEGYAFLGWSGIADEDSKYEPAVTVSIDEDVTAVFRKTDGSEPKSYGWVGANDAKWSATSSWSDEDGLRGVPVAHDVVTIPAGKTACLDVSTPVYAAVNVSGTLTMTNWTTCLSADAVTVLNGGNLTCGPAVKTEADLSRVWVKCGNLTVAEGGTVNVDKKGYAGASKGALSKGYGPGGAAVGYDQGASHGGYGGRVLDQVDYSLCKPTRLPYDDPSDPALPGSSGGATDWGAGGNGGGVIRIEATGTVTINGIVTANGGSTPNHGTASSSLRSTAGSGGSVNIRCSHLVGAGTIRANGGGGDKAESRSGIVGGGGMVAVRYDANVQTAEEVVGMTITAAAGLYSNSSGGAYSTTNVSADKDLGEADVGTLYFSDRKLIDALLGKGLTGQIRGVAEYATMGDLAFDFGHVRFAEEGVKVTVNGNLTFGGTDSRLEIGGFLATNRATFVNLYAGQTPSFLTVTGNLTLGGVSRLDVRAAATNGVDAFGAEVTVGGALSVGSNCYVYAWSDIANLGSPRFTVGSLDVMQGGTISADRRGGRGAYGIGSGIVVNGRGSGPGNGYYDTGAGYGGLGGTSGYNGGKTYGSAEQPLLPGSGGGAHIQGTAAYCEGGSGGGLICVVASNGAIHIDGTLCANGDTGRRGINPNGAGGSGGAIYLVCSKFYAGETAVLSAVGGATTPASSVASGAGGGGRIAVWCGETKTAGTPRGRISSADEPLTPQNVRAKHAQRIGEFFTCLCPSSAISAAGGVSAGASASDSCDGKPGSRFFAYVGEKTGMVLLLR